MLVTVSVFVTVCFAAPALALGATRYASPSGAGTACTQAAPCDVFTAVDDAPALSTVILAPGSYGSAASPLTGDHFNDNGNMLTLKGATAGTSRPVIYLNDVSSANDGIDLSGPGSSLSDLAIIASTANNVIDLSGSNETVNRVLAIGLSGNTNNACDVD
jgi:hypothetical protein